MERSKAEIETTLRRHGATEFMIGQDQSRAQADAAWEKSCRQRWRALALVVKAKLDAVELGVSSIAHEFMAHIVLPSGETLGQWFDPQFAKIDAGRMPKLLPGATR